ncbi:MAG: putative copper-containing nitrite reductase [Candidatus Scalindua rubra]|uniref:Copper-containing nitrite reductase n=1 Tax=Candidatus Scalindua rubra TaxID=1872076 RepID=A0A1E3XBW7_9BACT|nr:MAG: putative copper-containing nitrite reductase [Candidatus Scalindua rubra]
MKKDLSALFRLSLCAIVAFICLAGGRGFSVEISRRPDDLLGPLMGNIPKTVRVTLTAQEITATIDSKANVSFRYFTFNGRVPGPFIRVMEGDTLEVTLVNPKTNTETHTVDFHAIKGFRGGATRMMAPPGQSRRSSFQITRPGLYVYHCVGNGSVHDVLHHINNGMYGLILVEPRDLDNEFQKLLRSPNLKEFYVMQGEFHINDEVPGNMDHEKGLREDPDYVVFNGRVNALSDYPLRSTIGDNVIIYFGNAGPNKISSFHIVGEIFDKVWREGVLASPPFRYVQTTAVPAGGAAVLHLKSEKSSTEAGSYLLIDHSVFRIAKGAMGHLWVSGY